MFTIRFFFPFVKNKNLKRKLPKENATFIFLSIINLNIEFVQLKNNNCSLSVRQLAIRCRFPWRSVPSAVPPYGLSFSSKQLLFPRGAVFLSLYQQTSYSFHWLHYLCLTLPTAQNPLPTVFTSRPGLFHTAGLLWCFSWPTETDIFPLFMPNQGFENWRGARGHRSVDCMPLEIRRIRKLLSKITDSGGAK